MPGAYFTESDGTSLPEEDMIRSHSTTLASIPEDTEEWMFMEPPNLDSASMYGSMNTSFEDDMSLGRTLEDLETLPKEPTLEPTILEDDINVLNLPLEENKSNHSLGIVTVKLLAMLFFVPACVAFIFGSLFKMSSSAPVCEPAYVLNAASSVSA